MTERRCELCAAVLTKRGSEGYAQFAKRRTCGYGAPCRRASQARASRQGQDPEAASPPAASCAYCEHRSTPDRFRLLGDGISCCRDRDACDARMRAHVPPRTPLSEVRALGISLETLLERALGAHAGTVRGTEWCR